MKKHGFTLIELLVVIALLALLASLLLPAFGRAKAATRRATCINNCRQVNMALQLYVDEHTDSIGYTEDIYFSYKENIRPYLGQHGGSTSDNKVFDCPADDFPMRGAIGDMFLHSEAGGEGFCTQPWTHFSSYFFNGPARGTNDVVNITGLEEKPFSAVREPSKTLLLGEISGGAGFSTHARIQPLQFNNAQNVMSFADAHVAFIRMYWNGTPGLDGFPFFYEPPIGYSYKWSRE